MLDHHLIKRLVIPISNQLFRSGLVERARLFNQSQESAPAVVEMRNPVLDFRGTERMNVKANKLAAFAIAVAFQYAHLVEGTSQICAPKRFVLVKFQTVLIVEMQ